VQEALLVAPIEWPQDGVLTIPRGWLIQVATRRMIDHVRSEAARRRRESAVARQAASRATVVEEDDTLILLFMCCHPVLTPSSAIALTLLAVGRLTTGKAPERSWCRRRPWRSASAVQSKASRIPE
jgi:predicted RNA polymerase sigma factor